LSDGDVLFFSVAGVVRGLPERPPRGRPPGKVVSAAWEAYLAAMKDWAQVFLQFADPAEGGGRLSDEDVAKVEAYMEVVAFD
jgi:hypothetical protein